MHSIIFHAHQKIDRVARRNLTQLAPTTFFPGIRQILKFEAGRGPDGARLKRHKHSEQPWHFVDPHNEQNSNIHFEIKEHYSGLVEALRTKDEVRSGFEAAWLAHAIVDGLTPAHHHPYEQHLEELRGDHRDTRKGLSGRLYVNGETLSETLTKSAKLIGPKGLLTSHAMFEVGAFTMTVPLKLTKSLPSTKEIASFAKLDTIDYFNKIAKEIASLNIYERFCSTGWTQALARDVKNEMAPRMARTVTLIWFAAAREAAR